MADVRDSVIGGDDSDVESESSEYQSSSDSEPDLDDLNIKWSNLSEGLRLEQYSFTENSGLLVDIPGNNTPIDWFSLLLDDQFLETVCRETNAYALKLFVGGNISLKSRVTRWKDVEVEELKIFIGLLLHTGTIRLDRVQDYWKTNRLFNMPLFREYMSRDRFLLILRCLNFSSDIAVSSRNSQERLENVNLVINHFNNKMDSIYYPSKELSLDDPMILWRGKLVCHQNIKLENHRCGIKLYSLTEPSGLTLRFMIASGKAHSAKVVLKLMEGKLDKGHAIYLDDVYTSFSLASNLLSKKTYCTGTLKADRKNNPCEIKNAELKRGESKAQYANGIMVGKWRDKRTIMYLSSEYTNNIVNVTNKKDKEINKPLPIFQLFHMKRVDRTDQLLSNYPCECKYLRWYKKIFIHVLSMIVVNSQQLYNMYTTDKKSMSLYDFRIQLIESLLPKKQLAPLITPPRDPTHKLVQIEERDKKGGRKRKGCRVCLKNEKIRKMTTYTCSTCPGQPGLCAVNCFDEFHKRQQ